MDNYTHSDDTPEVNFDKDTNTYSIVGNSYMENCIKFYEPIKAFIENYESTGRNELNLFLHFNLLNSSSAVYLAQVIIRVSEIAKKGLKVNVKWAHDIHDEELLELGQKLSSISKLPFDYLAIEDDE